MENLDLFEPTFTYILTRSSRKSLVIHIKDGEVEIRAPLRTPLKLIREFIAEKNHWIISQLEEQRRKLTERLVITHGSTVCFFGIPRTFKVIQAARSKVDIDQDFLYIYTTDSSPDYLSRLFQKWLQKQAREYMASRTVTITRQLGVSDKLKTVVFRKTKTKWGHCCNDGTIQYNWLAMMAPQEVVDYLVAHESSHLCHMNHSARFWKTVESVCPEYRELKNWLGENGHKIWLD